MDGKGFVKMPNYNEKAEEIKDHIVDEISGIDRNKKYSGRLVKTILKEIIRKMEVSGLVSDRRRSMTEKLLKEW